MFHGRSPLLLVVVAVVIGVALWPSWPVFVAAVKHEDFKRCHQSGFCTRNRAFADWQNAYHRRGERSVSVDPPQSSSTASSSEKEDDIAAASSAKDTPKSEDTLLKAEVIPIGEPPHYRVDKASLRWHPRHGRIEAELLRMNPLATQQAAPLSLAMEFLEDGLVRMTVDEPVPQRLLPRSARHKVENVLIGGWKSIAFEVAELAPISSQSIGYQLSFPDLPLQIIHFYLDPFVVDVYQNGVLVVSINRNGYLNIENMRKSGEEDHVNVVSKHDSKLAENLWEESFGSHSDPKPNGPMSIGVDVSFVGAEHVYGIPEHATNLSLKTTRGAEGAYSEPYRLYNLDVFEFELDSPMALYGSVPFMIAHKKDRGKGTTHSAGFFLLNSAEMWVDVVKANEPTDDLDARLYVQPSKVEKKASTPVSTTTTHWIAESGVLDAFIMLGPSPKDVLRQYYRLTGSLVLPQLFALGYHQCRWNYLDTEDVARVHDAFEEHNIPVDVIWLDIEHTKDKRYFTWHETKFADPIAMQKDLARTGRKMVTIIDPHIFRDEQFHVKKLGSEKGLFVKRSDGSEFEGWCWPGSSSYMDYLNPAARKFWAELFAYDVYKGSTETLFTWNDMNEPSVFSSTEITMPKTNLHWNNVEHRDVHNIYGMLLHRSTYSGHIYRSRPGAIGVAGGETGSGSFWQSVFPGVGDGGATIDSWLPRESKDTGPAPHRPFVLSRAFFSGTQRYGAIWNGDNMAKWEHLASSAPMLLGISVAGVGFCGADVGGFFFDPETELLVRWYQAGIWYPFFRAHAHIDTKRREPWLFGEPYLTLIRQAILTRYQFLPYWYTLFRLGQTEGVVPMRPMFFEFPEDEHVYSMEDQYMVGGAILVKPIVKPSKEEGGHTVDVYLPGSEPWFDYYTHLAYASKQAPLTQNRHQTFSVQDLEAPVPVLIRAGSVVPTRQRARRSSAAMSSDPLTLHVTLAHDSTAKGEWYLDDGESFAYIRGGFVHKEMAVTALEGGRPGVRVMVKDKVYRAGSSGSGSSSTANHAVLKEMEDWQKPFLGEQMENAANGETSIKMTLETAKSYRDALNSSVGLERLVVLMVEKDAKGVEDGKVQLRWRRAEEGGTGVWQDASSRVSTRVHSASPASTGALSTREFTIKNLGVAAGEDWEAELSW